MYKSVVAYIFRKKFDGQSFFLSVSTTNSLLLSKVITQIKLRQNTNFLRRTSLNVIYQRRMLYDMKGTLNLSDILGLESVRMVSVGRLIFLRVGECPTQGWKMFDTF